MFKARLNTNITDDVSGCSASLDGDTVLTGVLGDDDNGDNSGSAYIFDLSDRDADGDGVLVEENNCSAFAIIS